MRRLKGIGELVKLFNSEHQEVQRFATGATRNLIFENMDNKVALIEEGGIPQLIEALRENDDELRKNITGTEPTSHFVSVCQGFISGVLEVNLHQMESTALHRDQSIFLGHIFQTLAKPWF